MRLHGGTRSISTRKKLRMSEWRGGPFFLPGQKLFGPNGRTGVVAMLIQSPCVQNGGMHIFCNYFVPVLFNFFITLTFLSLYSKYLFRLTA